MAGELVTGAAVGAVFGALLDAVKNMKDKATKFKPTLASLTTTLESIHPVIKEMEEQNHELGRKKEELEPLIKRMKEGRELVEKCSKIHRCNICGRIRYQDELVALGDFLMTFFMINIQAYNARDLRDILIQLNKSKSSVNKQNLVCTEKIGDGQICSLLSSSPRPEKSEPLPKKPEPKLDRKPMPKSKPEPKPEPGPESDAEPESESEPEPELWEESELLEGPEPELEPKLLEEPEPEPELLEKPELELSLTPNLEPEPSLRPNLEPEPSLPKLELPPLPKPEPPSQPKSPLPSKSMQPPPQQIMASSLVGGAAVAAVFGELLKAVLEVKDKATKFKQTLEYLEITLTAITPVIKEIEQHNYELGCPKEELQSLIKEMEKGTKLVYKCSKIQSLNIYARLHYQKQLVELVESVTRFFMIDLQARTARDLKETLLKVRRISSAVNEMDLSRTQDSTSHGSATEPVD